MRIKALKFFTIAAALWGLLIGLIHLGSYLKFALIEPTWHGTAAVISVIFIWVTIFTVTIVTTMKGVEIIRQHLRKKLQFDFAAWLGTLVADYNRKDDSINIETFFNAICNENGIKDVPDLKKFYKGKDNRNSVFEKIKEEIEFAASQHSRELAEQAREEKKEKRREKKEKKRTKKKEKKGKSKGVT